MFFKSTVKNKTGQIEPSIKIFEEKLDRLMKNVSQETSKQDTMYTGNPKGYFNAGRSAIECIIKASLFTKNNSFSKILDFACGYGRVLRVLRAAYPNAEISACDIEPDAVEFCSKTLQAIKIQSFEEPSKIQFSTKYDLIWVGSLFTHLELCRWPEFFKTFEKILSSDGLLIFTTAGDLVAETIKKREGHNKWLSEKDAESMYNDYSKTGYAFRPYPEEIAKNNFSDRCKLTNPVYQYGQTIVSTNKMITEVKNHTNLKLIHCSESGWANRQDVFAYRSKN